MLRFHEKRPDLSLLLSGAAQDRRPDRVWQQAYAALLERGWMRGGRTSTPPSASHEEGGEPQDPVMGYLVRAIVQERPEVLQLADEIRALAPLPTQDSGSVTALDLAKHYTRLVLSGKRETEAVAAARHELKHELEQERTEKAQALAELERQLQAAKKGQQEASEESELLLSQLHQVQEGLEHYFLAHQDAKTTLKTIEGGVSRVLAQLPGAFDCEQFEVQARGEMGEEVEVSAWAVRVPSGLRDKVGLAMRIDAPGRLWLDVERDGSGACLERWPIRAAEESKLSFCPLAFIDQSQAKLRLLAQLSASDWELLCGILRVLVQRMAQGLIELDERAAVAIRKAQAAWLNLPVVWRFDEVRLTSSSAEDSHEVIELSFDRVSIGQRRMQRFWFQLQAKRLAGDRIGLPAYLIFPRETVTQPLEVWLGNTKDVSGRGVMAIEVREGGPHRTLWANLQSVDRSMIVALCNALPFALSLLSAEPERSARAWKEWADLVQQLRPALARGF